jgi:hypothetical protein
VIEASEQLLAGGFGPLASRPLGGRIRDLQSRAKLTWWWP